MFDRLQQQQQRQQERQLEEMQVPGQGQDLRLAVPESQDGPCVTIQSVKFVTLGDEPLPFGAWFHKPVQAVEGACMGMTDIQALQAKLSNLLIDRGYVTSRVLVPEQDLASGELTLLVVAGRIESFEANGLPLRVLKWASPEQSGDLVNLRGLEHTVETLARLPNLDAQMDLAPGQQQGGTVVIGNAQWPRRYQGSLVIDEAHFGDVTHGTAQLGLDWGSPFGVTDRVSVNLNSDLDTEYSDQAWGAGLSYDVSLGYWNLALSYNRQQYQNEVEGVFQKFDTDGATDTSRLELTRTLYRSNKAQLSFTTLGSYSDIENRLEDVVIRVSSYQLRTLGGRVNAKLLWGKTQYAGTLTIEEGWGTGPATHLAGGKSIAESQHTRYQAYATASRFIKPLYGTFSLRVNSQYANDVLFPSEKFSVASSSAVRGYRDVSLSGNSATAGTVQFDFYPPVTGPVSVTPFLAYDLGMVPGNQNEPGGFERLASTTAGAHLGYRSFRLTTEITWPLKQQSTQQTDNEYSLHASLYAQF